MLSHTRTQEKKNNHTFGFFLSLSFARFFLFRKFFFFFFSMCEKRKPFVQLRNKKRQVKTSVTVLSSCLQLRKWFKLCVVFSSRSLYLAKKFFSLTLSSQKLTRKKKKNKAKEKKANEKKTSQGAEKKKRVNFLSMNTYSNRRVANHLHGLIFELKERMNSRQDRPVMQSSFFFFFLRVPKHTKKPKKKKKLCGPG
jgi:hypothetical protein